MKTTRPLRPPVRLRFTPVPVAARRDGWTPPKQRAFIDVLASVGVVSMAAQHVGMSAKSAYRLRARADAASFARAWDRAISTGRVHAQDQAISRALEGEWQPIVRLGRAVGWKHSFNTKLLLGLAKIHSNQRDRAENRANGNRDAP